MVVVGGGSKGKALAAEVENQRLKSVEFELRKKHSPDRARK